MSWIGIGFHPPEYVSAIIELEEKLQTCNNSSCGKISWHKKDRHLYFWEWHKGRPPKNEKERNDPEYGGGCSATEFTFGLSNGKTARLVIFQLTPECLGDIWFARWCIKGSKISSISMDGSKATLYQIYSHLHMKLVGPCFVGTEKDMPYMSRLDKLEEQVKALHNAESDLPNNSVRIAALEKRVHDLERPESSNNKRTKT